MEQSDLLSGDFRPPFPVWNMARSVAELEEKLAALSDEAQVLEAATRGRAYTEEEERHIDAVNAEFEALYGELTRSEKMEGHTARLARGTGRRTAPTGPAAHDGMQAQRPAIAPFGYGDDGEAIYALGKGQPMSALYPNPQLSWDKWIRGIVFGTWRHAPHEFRAAMEEGTPASGGHILVPIPLSAMWIDLARVKSRVLEAGAQIVPMSSQTLRIARVNADPTLAWRAEATALPVSVVGLEGVILQSRVIGGIVEVTVELEEDAPNLGQVVLQTLSRALASSVDKAALSGPGGVAPQGIIGAAGVQTITGVGALTSFKPFSQAVQKVWEANGA